MRAQRWKRGVWIRAYRFFSTGFLMSTITFHVMCVWQYCLQVSIVMVCCDAYHSLLIPHPCIPTTISAIQLWIRSHSHSWWHYVSYSVLSCSILDVTMPCVFCFPLLTLSTLALIRSAFLPSSYNFPYSFWLSHSPSEAPAAFLKGFFGRLCFLEWLYREEGTVVKDGWGRQSGKDMG